MNQSGIRVGSLLYLGQVNLRFFVVVVLAPFGTVLAVVLVATFKGGLFKEKEKWGCCHLGRPCHG